MERQNRQLKQFQEKWQQNYNVSSEVRKAIDYFLSLKAVGERNARQKVEEKGYIVPFALLKDMNKL
jgi:hypothetical protein